MSTDIHLDKRTPEVTIAQIADSARRTPDGRETLAQLLPERIALYEGRGSNEIVRIRGYIFAAFEEAGLPETALPYVLEELESGHEAYIVAGAAKAVRGMDNPGDELVPFLLKAVENIRDRDDAVSFESYRSEWPLANYTTALTEIFRTLGWLGVRAQSALPDLEALLEGKRGEFSERARAEIATAIERIHAHADDTPHHDCCSPVAAPLKMAAYTPRERRAPSAPITDVELEDQDGRVVSYEAFFSGKPSIVAFFYTRCNNPNKCSLTISKLARLQKAIVDGGLEGMLKTAAITYDPEYDLPPRLRAYGENRDILFGEENRIFRNRSKLDALWEFFQLGVNFTGTTVNRHRIELFILDQQGEVAATFSRLQWDEEAVLEQAKALLRSNTK